MVEGDACLAGHMEDSPAVGESCSPAAVAGGSSVAAAAAVVEGDYEGSPVAENGLGAAEEGAIHWVVPEGEPGLVHETAEEGTQHWVVPEDNPGLIHETALTGYQHGERMWWEWYHTNVPQPYDLKDSHYSSAFHSLSFPLRTDASTVPAPSCVNFLQDLNVTLV